MSWVRIDDQIGRHQKFLDAGPAASWLWVLGLAHCQSQLTDGFISDKVLPLIGIPKGYRPLALRLASVGLFDRVAGGYQIHDYLHYNDSKEKALAHKAELHTARVRAGHAGGLAKASKRLANAKQVATSLLVAKSSPIPSPTYEEQDQDHRLRRSVENSDDARPKRPKPPPMASFQVTCAIIGHLFEEPPPTGASSWLEVPPSEIAEQAKEACAKAGMGYDNGVIHKAVDALTRLRRPVENSSDFTDLKAVLKHFDRGR